jgi:hypothetical protein
VRTLGHFGRTRFEQLAIERLGQPIRLRRLGDGGRTDGKPTHEG